MSVNNNFGYSSTTKAIITVFEGILMEVYVAKLSATCKRIITYANHAAVSGFVYLRLTGSLGEGNSLKQLTTLKRICSYASDV